MSSEQTDSRICRRCLLRDMSEDGVPGEISSYIEAISLDDRTPDDVYENRLAVCRACSQLLNGTCLSCGCYVEIRAAINVKKCPLFPPKW
ncbi:MAG TPA: hypothetical protein DCM57_00305 [Treponema sp.]|nr:hypothetical protein [Treponema sp.]